MRYCKQATWDTSQNFIRIKMLKKIFCLNNIPKFGGIHQSSGHLVYCVESEEIGGIELWYLRTGIIGPVFIVLSWCLLIDCFECI